MVFSESNADFNIIEVGMGAKQDPTNLFEVELLCAIITTITLDHTKHLGNTIEEIADHKKYIIKRDAFSIIGTQNDGINSIIKDYAYQQHSMSFFYKEDFEVVYEDDDHFVLQISDKMMEIISTFIPENMMKNKLLLLKPNLIGDHQLNNASIAIIALLSGICKLYCMKKDFIQNNKLKFQKLLSFSIVNEELIYFNDIVNAIKKTYWPYRMHQVKKGKLYDLLPKNTELYIDGAHNEGGAKIIADCIRKLELQRKMTTYIIVGRSRDVDNYNFMKHFKDIVDTIFCVRGKMESYSEAPETILKSCTLLDLNAIIKEDIQNAMDEIISRETKPCRIIICGSLYLAKDLRHFNGHWEEIV